LIRFVTVGQYIGRSLFDEVDRSSVVVDSDDRGVRLDLNFRNRGDELVELVGRQIGEVWKSRHPTRIHDVHRATEDAP
jgi:hypothetical protein